MHAIGKIIRFRTDERRLSLIDGTIEHFGTDSIQLIPLPPKVSSAPLIRPLSWNNTFQTRTTDAAGTAMGIKNMLRRVLPIPGMEYSNTANAREIMISNGIQIAVNLPVLVIARWKAALFTTVM